MNENTHPTTQSTDVVAVVRAHQQVSHDLKNALLIVSLVVNLAVITTWLVLTMTARYDVALASFLLGR